MCANDFFDAAYSAIYHLEQRRGRATSPSERRDEVLAVYGWDAGLARDAVNAVNDVYGWSCRLPQPMID